MEPETHELIAGYALDALDAEDHARVEELLRTSEEARDELRAFSDAVAGLAVAAGGPEPRPELRERILAAAHAEEQNVVSLEGRRRRLAPLLGAAAAVAAAAAIGLGLYAVSLADELDDTCTALERQRDAAAILADPAVQTVALRTGEGKLVVAGGGDAVLVVDGLAPAPSGKTYQAWVVLGESPLPAGTFESGGARTVVPLREQVGGSAVVAVTVERAGGVDAPTSDPVVASAPA